MNKVCAKINCYKGFSYEETLNGIKNAGLKYVELSVSNGNSLGLSQDMSKEELNDFLNDMKSRGLTPISLGGNSYIMDEDTSKIIKNIEIANILGCHTVVETVFNPRNITDEYSSDEDIANHIKFYVPYLEKYNLDMAIELHRSYATGKTIKSILKLVNSDHVHINYDTGNAIFYGKLDLEEMIEDYKECIDFISYMHVKDKLDEKDVWNFPALGKGYVPFKELFEHLKKNNKDFILSIEVEFTKEGPNDVEEVNKALIESAQYMKSLGFEL